MALVKKQSNSTRLVVIGVVIIAVAGIGYLLFQQFTSTSSTANSAVGAGHPKIITNFGESILQDSRFTNLKHFGTNISVNVNTDSGQPQPFQ